MNTVTQLGKYEKLSDKYQQVNTQEVVKTLVDNGFEVTSTQVTRARSKDKQGFQKHLIRLKHPNITFGNDERPEIILINSHDGTTSFRIQLGIFRFVCANGLIVGNTFGGFKHKHIGSNLKERVQYEVDRLVAHDLPKLKNTIDSMKNSKLSVLNIADLASKLVKLRLPENAVTDSKTYHSLVTPLREEDKTQDLWTVYNTMQEKLIRGGIEYTNEKGKQRKTRAIKAINEVIRLNTLSFELASKLIA